MIDRSKKRVRRRPRFRLATLLLAVTLLAVWLADCSERARRQKRAVESLEFLRPAIYYDYELSDAGSPIVSAADSHRQLTGRGWNSMDVAPPGPAWLRGLIGKDYFQTVAVVSVWMDDADDLTEEHLRQIGAFDQLRILELDSAYPLENEYLAHLHGLARLERLFVACTRIGDAGLPHVAKLRRLKYLGLAYTRVTDRGLASLEPLSELQVLELSNTGVTDAGLKHLRPLKSLRLVFVDGTKVSPQGARQLEAALPGCHVSLCSPEKVGIKQAQALRRALDANATR